MTYYSHNSNKLNQVLAKSQAGFTLIELMVVIAIVAILAAIAIPSYRQYVIRNAEKETQAQMQSIALQLDRWRASQLSYKGFYPQNGVDDATGKPKYGYDNGTMTEINVPLKCQINDCRYTITLVDGSNTSNSLVPTGNGVDVTVARSWKMLATPNANSVVGDSGHAFIMSSTGQRCQKPVGGTVTANIDDKCGTTGWEAW